MKKTIRRAICVVLCLLTALGTTLFTACSFDSDREQFNNSKTQLYVGVYEGGFGDAFLYQYKEEFEELYKDYVIGDKKGIQVMIRADKNYEFSSLINSIAAWDRDIYFTMSGGAYNSAAKMGALLDITDIATETLQDEGKSIVDKMNTSYRDWFNIDGKYYALPQYEGAYSLSYDVDLFNNNKLFIKKDYENSSNLVLKFSCGENDSDRSYGPNGLKGDYDDGLPATYDDFFDLCDRMVQLGITPVLWAGSLQNYISNSMMSFYTDFEGQNNAKTHFSFNGTTDIVTGFDGSGKPIINSSYSITSANGYDVFKQPGMYYALEFLYKLVQGKGKYYNFTDCFGGTLNHTEAQRQFVYGASDQKESIGILFEGNWWYNEAKGAREQFEDYFKIPTHRYAMMPLPKAPNAYHENRKDADNNVDYYPTTLLDCESSINFINAKIESSKKDIAKKFLQFALTNKALSTFTRLTSTTCPYEYTMSQEDYNNTPYFGQKMYELHNNITYFLPNNTSNIFLKYPELVKPTNFWKTSTATIPSNNFKNLVTGGDGMTPKDYFNEIGTYYTANWSSYVN